MQIVLLLGLIMAMDSTDVDSTDRWRADYETGLRAPRGWLSLAGLFWLQPGQNTVALPARCGGRMLQVEFHDSRASISGRELALDDETEDACGISAVFIRRGSRFAIRLRDPQASTRRDFHGLSWFPVNDRYRIRADWHPYRPAKKIPITNILGDTQDEECPGYAEFRLDETVYKLEPTIENGKLFFMFRDLTSSDSTYGAGRFLKSEFPSEGFVQLNFNRAYNPPCAYTEFATCPLPPRQNRMDTRVNAGEKRYAAH